MIKFMFRGVVVNAQQAVGAFLLETQYNLDSTDAFNFAQDMMRCVEQEVNMNIVTVDDIKRVTNGAIVVLNDPELED